MIKDRNAEIEITDDHIKLAKELIISWQDHPYSGHPEVDAKRPYGNSNVEEDLAEHLPHLEEKERWRIHREMTEMLQILIQFADLEKLKGKYYQPRFEYLKWTKEE